MCFRSHSNCQQKAALALAYISFTVCEINLYILKRSAYLNIRTYSTLPASHPMAIPSDKHYSKKETVRSQRKNICDKATITSARWSSASFCSTALYASIIAAAPAKSPPARKFGQISRQQPHCKHCPA